MKASTALCIQFASMATEKKGKLNGAGKSSRVCPSSWQSFGRRAALANMLNVFQNDLL